MTDPRRSLPSVGALLDREAARPLLAHAPRALVTEAIRDALAEARRAPASAPRTDDEWRAAIAAALDLRQRPSLRPVHNATGVVLHTNLGRAPLAGPALTAIANAAAGHANLEYDVERGVRGSRYTHCVSLLCELTGAEDALVVNNGAAALLLALNTFAEGRQAIVSRGELIEIGGSFRIPDIMTRSGAVLREVGTTNRTHSRDYIDAVSPDTAAMVKVHRSNFAQTGYVADVPAREVMAIAVERDLTGIFDLGSGLLVSLEAHGLAGEPLASEAVASGATIVTMSGDKLLGGPQAGIVLGRADAVGRLKRNPLARALRVDKLTLAALEATLALYREPERALREIPALHMLTMDAAQVHARATTVWAALDAAGIPCDVLPTAATVGGGAFPAATIPSWAVAPRGNARELEQRLRQTPRPVVARVAEDRLLLDLRSVPERTDAAFTADVIAALS